MDIVRPVSRVMPDSRFTGAFDRFHEMASQATGQTDFGCDDYHEPLRTLLLDLDALASLTQTGYESVRRQIVGMLAGRLMFHRGIREYPESQRNTIARPLFIVGMGRTGTTALHRILSKDPTRQTLPFWLANLPMPRPPEDTWGENPYFQMIERGMAESTVLNENMRAIHPMAPHLPDECKWAIDQTFWTSTLQYTYDLAGYDRWYHQVDPTYAYEYFYKLLCLVANGDDRGWILKDPSHLYGMDALLSVFPDACVVQMHREPVDCMRSFANLGWQVRPRVLDGSKQELYGAKILHLWSRALRKMEAVRRRRTGSQFLDVHIQELRTDPIGTIERVFDHFGFPISAETRSAWLRQIREDPRVGHLKRHAPPDFGLTRDEVNRAVGDYLERYREVCENANVGPG